MKFMLAAALVAAMSTFVSCTQDEDMTAQVQHTPENAIKFNVVQKQSMGTRDSFNFDVTNSSNWKSKISNFDVWATVSNNTNSYRHPKGQFYMGSPFISEGAHFIGGDGSYSGPNVYWPHKSVELSFLAITPAISYLGNYIKDISTASVDTVMKVENENYCVPKVSFTIDLSGEKAVTVPDIMCAASTKNTQKTTGNKSAVKLYFKHMLVMTEVRVAVINEFHKIVVKSVKLKNIYQVAQITAHNKAYNNIWGDGNIILDYQEKGDPSDLDVEMNVTKYRNDSIFQGKVNNLLSNKPSTIAIVPQCMQNVGFEIDYTLYDIRDGSIKFSGKKTCIIQGKYNLHPGSRLHFNFNIEKDGSYSYGLAF